MKRTYKADQMNDKIELELAEDEDLARAKAWWKENGSSIIGGIVIGTTMVVSYNYWQKYQDNHALEVAQLYETYTSAPQDTKALSDLVDADATATYTQLARLTAAKQAVAADRFEQAEAALNEVLATGSESGLRGVATLRLAGVLLAQGKNDDAISLLEQVTGNDADNMAARIAELQADAYLSKGDMEKATALYDSSIAALVEAGQPTTLVQLKRDNL